MWWRASMMDREETSNERGTGRHWLVRSSAVISNSGNSATQDEALELEVRFTLEAGEDTSDLDQFVFQQADLPPIDELVVKREFSRPDGLASEPITVTVIIGAAATTAVVIGRIVERWLENRRQREAVRVIVEVARELPELAEQLIKLEREHSRVSVSYRLMAKA
jgi:hypothetical protein